jgi:hypothetical protein
MKVRGKILIRIRSHEVLIFLYVYHLGRKHVVLTCGLEVLEGEHGKEGNYDLCVTTG